MAESFSQATITLDSTIKHQIFTGWESTPFITEPCDPNFSKLRDNMLKLAVDEIGINRIRLEIRSGVENNVDHYSIFVNNGCPDAGPDYLTWRQNRYATVNDNNDPNSINWSGYYFTNLDHSIDSIVLPMRKLMQATGEALHINLCYVAFTGQIVNGMYIHDNPNEYAEVVLATYLHMKDKYGFVPDTWEVILEPDLVAQWNTGTVVGKAIAAAAIRLKENGFTPRFIAPSTTNMSNAIPYFDAMIQVPGVLPYLEELSYHRYSGVSPESLQTISDRGIEHNVNTSMLEHWFDNATYHILHEDLTIGRNSAWQSNVISALFNINGSDISISKTQQFIRQYSKFIRKDAQRIQAISNDEFNFNPIAFINKNGTYVVVVKVASGGGIDISGLRPDTYGVRFTTTDQFNVDLPDVNVISGASLNTTIPSGGVITMYGKGIFPTSIYNSKEESQIKVYPNPATHELYINTENDILYAAEIINVHGKTLLSINPESNGQNIFNIEQLSSGIYFLKMKTKEGTESMKLIVLK